MSDETIDITVYGKSYRLTKLQRHILYCCVDGKAPSTRLYSDDEIEGAYRYLLDLELISPMRFGTTVGEEVVEACKARPRD